MASTILALEIGNRIAELRIARGWSQTELAKRAGLGSKSLISYYELGERYPSCESVIRLADALGVTTDYLLRGASSEANDGITSETNQQGDTYIRIRPGVLSNTQIEALLALVRKLHDDKD